MVKTISQVIESYARDVKKAIPDSKVFLFGSFAKGNYDKESDIDIAVFSNNFKQLSPLEAHHTLSRIARKYYKFNADIQPLAFSYDEMENIFAKQEIIRKGIEIL